MAFSCRSESIPGDDSYAAALAHFDSVKPWRSKYNPDGEERPIGDRAVKNTGRQFNRAMRKLEDGSIAFRLFDTDVVVYHPDETITIQGYATMSTSGFIDALAPAGIQHSYRQIRFNGRLSHTEDPVLHLMPTRAETYGSDRTYQIPVWSKAMVIRCDDAVRLTYSADGVWVPVDLDDLVPFQVPTLDRKAARAVSKQYGLTTLQQVVNAMIALKAAPPPFTGNGYSTDFRAIMQALEAGDTMAAVELMPRGTTQAFGKTHGTERGVQPGFITRLRNHIYEHEGVVDRVAKQTLTSHGYRKYVADVRRFEDA